MAEIDLRRLPADEFVLHFGGRPNEVDAFTFSNSLIALSEALQEVNRQISPDAALEVTIEGIGPGSFRAKIKTARKGLSGLFTSPAVRGAAVGLVVNIVSALIMQRWAADAPKIVVSDDLVVIESGHDRIIIPKRTWEAKEKLPAPQRAERHISRAFAAMEDDPSVTNFGILGHMADETPVAIIPRESFPRLASPELTEADDDKRYRDERTRLTVLRAILERSTTRRWQFVWQWIRIGAPIKDEGFFNKLASGEYRFGQGDVLEVMLRIYQTRDDVSGVFLNTAYEVLTVFSVQRREPQRGLLDH